MNGNTKNTAIGSINLSFDVGHDSIGWAVIDVSKETKILGCGSVIFQADDCMASQRRDFRRARRNIRTRRKRIERLKMLFEFTSPLSKNELDARGSSSPWKQAAAVLNGGQPLSWFELWNVIRWYAHNRGYDGNRNWANDEGGGGDDDTEKLQNASALMEKYKTSSMAETVCAVSGIDPLGAKSSAAIAPKSRFKSLNAAFDRNVVRNEVEKILRSHVNILEGLSVEFIRCLIGNDHKDENAWKAIKLPDLQLPKRYHGSLLFGQLLPRFDNRIITKCPLSGEKVPTRRSPEFLKYRWAMQLANVRVRETGETSFRALKTEERLEIDSQMTQTGFFTKQKFKQLVRSVSNCVDDNLGAMLLHPDAADALVLDPVKKYANSRVLKELIPLLPERNQKLVLNRWRKGKAQTISTWLLELDKSSKERALLEQAISKAAESADKRRELIDKEYHFPQNAPGRAPYARKMLLKAAEEVMKGIHPLEKEGCLFVSDEIRQRQLNLPLTERTNNHLIRHRLLLLKRLLQDVVDEYANGDREQVGKVTIEVNRELREFSGKSAQAIKMDLGLRLSNHRKIAEKLKNGLGQTPNASLIRKARVAEDLGWECPYTGHKFDMQTLAQGGVDREHIIPRSLRPTDALDALVMTFPEVNKMKGRQTAMRFIEEHGGEVVEGAPNLTIRTPAEFRAFVEGLKTRGDHADDQRRKKRRRDWLLLLDYTEQEFTPGDLTRTSQLVRLGASVISQYFEESKLPPQIVSMPGSVTGTVRKNWRLIGCLSKANKGVINEDGSTKTKTDIRKVTHLHHALDACVLGLSSHFIPNNGRIWELIVKRNHTPIERKELTALAMFECDSSNRIQMRDLPLELKAQLTKRLAECRVKMHIPSKMQGMVVEQNTWRVLNVANGEAKLQQRLRNDDGSLPNAKVETKNTIRLLGIDSVNAGKLKNLKGALVIKQNYGVALEPEPIIIPFHKVWQKIRELKKTNGGRHIRVIRNGSLIRISSGSRMGIWRVVSLKNTTSLGIALGLAKPDGINVYRDNAPVSKLISDGLELIDCPLTSLDISKVMYANKTQRKRKPKEKEGKE
ncbi:hypothetical protein N8648_04695 [Verrucomicrobia bacterium]|nr:hypothetical protein [Verrucomicrobiota bacterium]